MPPALSSAYRGLVFGICDMPPALSSAYRGLVFGELRYAFGIKLRLSRFGFWGIAICLWH
ncbi:hypothetical protein [Brunnivagina elsteri]|uniref:Uncharacterized protein n=1 Tax=Brunnivagina elsteri CCALA 953 TaxID=987040 RepID=A0A2A2TCC8_9CYAN|nr:hypothetical protein [Calothrix elsteri]PAX51457.1 hypothetical protein CK510_24690 [Calothrix elsteri CCALA 953]